MPVEVSDCVSLNIRTQTDQKLRKIGDYHAVTEGQLQQSGELAMSRY
jgi:hypothetical protein